MDARLTLRGRLGAARISCDSAPAECKDATSRAQANAIVDLMRRHGPDLTADDRAALLEQAVAVPWAPSDMQLVCDTIVGPAAGQASTVRRHSQEFLSIVHYFDEARWAALLAPESSDSAKEELIISLARSLGLTLPCEFTFKRMTCLVMMLCEEWSALSARSSLDKKHNNLLFKRRWQSGARKAVAPDIWIQALPTDPAKYQSLYPSLWSTTYAADCGPIKPQVDMRRLSLLDASFRCRGGCRRSWARAHAATWPVGPQ